MNFIKYPLKFYPILKKKTWGGNSLSSFLNKKISKNSIIGESWEISGIKNNESIISNGCYKGKSINDLINKFNIYVLGKKFGDCSEFPLLYKFIDAAENLSIQVHPDNKTAQKFENKNIGKNECWYIINSKTKKIVVGYPKQYSMNTLKKMILNNDNDKIINFLKIKNYDTIDIPAGTIHSILKDTLIAEIQTPADITYRVFDWNRNLKHRPLHLKKSADSIKNTNSYNFIKKPVLIHKNDSVIVKKLVLNKFYKMFEINLKKEYKLHFKNFVILSNLSDSINIQYNTSNIKLFKGETILLPASLKTVKLKNNLKKNSKILMIKC